MLFLILLISKQIYKPVRDLRHKMENMELDNLKTDIQLSGSADEIELFNHVFAEMLERINTKKMNYYSKNTRTTGLLSSAAGSRLAHIFFIILFILLVSKAKNISSRNP